MKAADIMTTKIVTIDSLATIAEAAEVMQQNNIKALIVERASDRDAYGIITVTDVSHAIANAKNPRETYVCEVMTKPCIVVNPDLAVEHIAKLFARAKIHIAPVIKDKLIGIISITDILTKTDCFDIITQSIPQTSEDSAQLFLDESRETDSDLIYEAWCSG